VNAKISNAFNQKRGLKWQFHQMGLYWWNTRKNDHGLAEIYWYYNYRKTVKKDLFKVWNWFGISMKTKPPKNNWLWFANELFREWMYVFLFQFKPIFSISEGITVQTSLDKCCFSNAVELLKNSIFMDLDQVQEEKEKKCCFVFTSSLERRIRKIFFKW